MLKIFLIGYSGVGKTTLSNLLIDKLKDVTYIKAGGWVRESFTKLVSVNVMTEFAKQSLKENPNSALNYINEKLSYAKNKVIIDGIRNPRDFIHLFDYRKDLVVFLNRNGVISSSEFEENGINIIKDYCVFLQKLEFTSDFYILNIHLNNKNEYSSVRSEDLEITSTYNVTSDCVDMILTRIESINSNGIS